MMSEKITEREMFEAIREIAEAVERNDIIDFCEKKIEQLRAKAEKARERAEAKKVEDPIYDAVKACLTVDLQIPEQILEQIKDIEELSVPKVRARLTKLVKEGFATKDEVDVEGKKRMAYAIASADVESDEE